jgi:ribosomal protein S27AE
MKKSLEPLRLLAGQLAVLQAEARALGMFAGDRELVACPRCGLMEDVTFTGLLITCRASALGEDTGLRFEEIKAGKSRCPKCGGIVTETPETPAAKTRQAKRTSRK